MAKKSSVKTRDKAVKKFDKAVNKAVKKGVPANVLEETVNDALRKATAKEPPGKGSKARASGRTRKRPAPTAQIQDDDLD